ncbi:MAG TPA: hypothetical protein VF042_16615 [Gemmatimonadaceae bacterium]
MYIEMLDLLRCPVEHEETWLVASFHRMDGRFVIEGKLGCPICSAEYEITNGVADFGGARQETDRSEADDDAVIRTAALLNLTRPGSLAVLCGETAGVANRLAEMTQARIIALNPLTKIEETELVGVVTTAGRIPLASSSVDAIAIGECNVAADAVRILKPGSRISARATVDLSPWFTVLAKDENDVVAEAKAQIVELRRSNA